MASAQKSNHSLPPALYPILLYLGIFDKIRKGEGERNGIQTAAKELRNPPPFNREDQGERGCKKVQVDRLILRKSDLIA